MMSNRNVTKTRRRDETRKAIICFVIFLSLLNFACRSEEEINVNVNKKNTAPEKKVDDFQEILKSYETAGFKFIVVFRRPDGDVLSGEDKKFLKDNSPIEINRWNLTEDGKIAVAGSNYKFPPESIEALKTRFAVEDYSKPNPGNADRNSNSNQNSNSVK